MSTLNDLINCQPLKEEYYSCLQKENLSFNPEILKFKATGSFEKVGQLKIKEETIKKCKGEKLAKCLAAKYELKNINEKELAKYYEEKYDQAVKKNNENILKEHSLQKNDQQPNKEF
jgi:hypothetical protein